MKQYRGFWAMTLLFVVAALFLFTKPAHAYIDPGTGGMILQAFLAVAVAGLAFGKQIWNYATGLLGGKNQSVGRDDEE